MSLPLYFLRQYCTASAGSVGVVVAAAPAAAAAAAAAAAFA